MAGTVRNSFACHRTVNIGFLEQFREAPHYSRTLPQRHASRAASDQHLDATEVLHSRTTTRRGRTKREYLVRYPGDRQSQRIAHGQLKEVLSPAELEALFEPLGLGEGICSTTKAAAHQWTQHSQLH